MARAGGFGSAFSPGGLTLDPFGGSRGGLGRYNVGDTMASLEAAEQYAVAVGWQNGTVSDEDYLASLHRAIELAPEGSRDRVSAQDRYDDAVYTIGRNKLVRDVNNAPTDGQRITAYQALIAYDQTKLGTMVEDNEQKRELKDRIAGVEANIRETRWSQMVRKYNNDEIGNAQMIDFARRAAVQSQGAPDQQTWADRVSEFAERIADEHLTQLMQDYQMDRVDGSEVLAYLDQRLQGMSSDSPRFRELTRQREDFAKSFHADSNAEKYSEMYDKYQEGAITDGEWLSFLATRVEDAPRGSEERRSAKHDLLMETFRTTEARLYYNISVNGADEKTLINFYRTTLLTMDSKSARARELRQKINQLELGGIDTINLGGNSADNNTPGSNTGHHVGGNNVNSGSGLNAAVPNTYYVGNGGHIFANRPTPHTSSSNPTMDGISIDEFMQALARGEGGTGAGAYTAQNATTDAYGKYQHLPQYWAGRAKRYLGDKNAPPTPANQEAVTRAMVQQLYDNLGDWRLVALAWRNGNARDTNPNTWSVRNQKYVNRVMRRLGSDMWTKTTTDGIYMPDNLVPYYQGTKGYEDDDLGSVAPPRNNRNGGNRGQNQNGKQNNGGAQGNGQQATQPATLDFGPRAGKPMPPPERGDPNIRQPTPLSGAMTDIAKEVVRQLGGNPNSDTTVRAVAVWLNAENGGGIEGNNPFGLQTSGARDLAGQINRTSDGYAIFGNWRDGVNAAVAEIQQYSPDIATAVRQNKPDAILRGASTWRNDNYGGANALFESYNQSGPSSILIGGTRIYETPASLAGLTDRAHVDRLFELDPGSATQMAWIDQNIAALAAADTKYDATGATNRSPATWVFTDTDGSKRTLPYDPEMYYQALGAREAYATAGGDTDTAGRVQTKMRDMNYEITTDNIDAGKRLAQTLLNKGDLAGAFNISLGLVAAADQISLNPDYTTDQKDSLLAGLLPKTEDNADGDPLLGLWDDEKWPSGEAPFAVQWNANHTAVTAIAPNEDMVYFTQDDKGDVVIRTWKDHRDDFDPVADIANVSGGDVNAQVPKYLADPMKVRVNVPGLGVPLILDVSTTQVNAAFLDTSNYRNPAVAAQKPPNLLGTGLPGDPLGPAHEGYFDPKGAWVPPYLPLGTRSWNNGQLASDTINGPAATRGGKGWWNNLPQTTAQDALITPSYQTIDMSAVRWIDPKTGQEYFAYTLDDPHQIGARFVLYKSSAGTGHLPTPVLDAARFKAGDQGQLQVRQPDGTWADYKPSMGTLGSLGAHFYGTDPADNANGQVGAPSTWMPSFTLTDNVITFPSLTWRDQEAMDRGIPPLRLAIRDVEYARNLTLGTNPAARAEAAARLREDAFSRPAESTQAATFTIDPQTDFRITGSTTASITRLAAQRAADAADLAALRAYRATPPVITPTLSATKPVQIASPVTRQPEPDIATPTTRKPPPMPAAAPTPQLPKKRKQSQPKTSNPLNPAVLASLQSRAERAGGI